MESIEMYKSLNKGIPNYIPIELDIETVIRECSCDPQMVINDFRTIGNEHQKDIAKIAGMTKAERAFFKTFRLWTNKGNAETKIYVSPITFIIELKRILGVECDINDYDSEKLLQLLSNKVDALYKIKTPEELKKQFPIIYNDYLLSISSSEQIKSLTGKKSPQIIKQQWDFYDMYGLSSNFTQFMNRQRIMYRNLVNKRKTIMINMNHRDIDLSYFKGINKERFELYLAHKYLMYANNCTTLGIKQECIYYLCTYIRETKFTEATITDEFGKKVTFKGIVQGYRRLFKKNIELKPVDADREKFKGFHISHVKNHVRKHYLSGINWHIVPKGHDSSKANNGVIDCLNRVYRHLTPSEREAKIREAYDLYERKVNFFENTEYIEKVLGLGEFNGYLAYFYPNGTVIMEKFFDDYAESMPTKNEAIYTLKVRYFETLSKLSKTKLMKDERCTRIIHSGNWEERVKKLIDVEPTEESTNEVQKVLTRLKEKQV